MSQPQSSALLSHLQKGQSAEITGLIGSSENRLRLINLGFHTHSEVRLLNCYGRNAIVNVDGSQFAIDRQLCEQVLIKEAHS